MKLSPREQQIAELLVLDLHNHEIAGRLGIAHSTVKTYLQRLMLKSGTRSRLGLALWFERTVSPKRLSSIRTNSQNAGCA